MENTTASTQQPQVRTVPGIRWTVKNLPTGKWALTFGVTPILVGLLLAAVAGPAIGSSWLPTGWFAAAVAVVIPASLVSGIIAVLLGLFAARFCRFRPQQVLGLVAASLGVSIIIGFIVSLFV